DRRQRAVGRVGELGGHPLVAGEQRQAAQVVQCAQAVEVVAGERPPVPRAALRGPRRVAPELLHLQRLQTRAIERLELRIPVRAGGRGHPGRGRYLTLLRSHVSSVAGPPQPATSASTREGLPVPSTRRSGATITIAPVAGSALRLASDVTP